MIKSAVFLLAICAGLTAQPTLTWLGPGTPMSFSVDRIFPNPMSNPKTIFTDFNLPDTLDVRICITVAKGDTLVRREYEKMIPGRYQFAWSVEGNRTPSGVGNFILCAYDNGTLRYYCNMSLLLIK
jgi:hypothetical protein